MLPEHQFQTVPTPVSIYASQRLCPTCASAASSNFGLALLGGVLVVLMGIQMILSFFSSSSLLRP
jgi:hypothetical protein